MKGVMEAMIDAHMIRSAREDERRAYDALLTLVAEDGEHGVSRPRRLVMVRWQHMPLRRPGFRLEAT